MAWPSLCILQSNNGAFTKNFRTSILLAKSVSSLYI